MCVALRGALPAVRERDGGLVETYPPAPQIPAGRAHGGTISMFEREGFTIGARPNAPYVVMQRII